VYAAWDIRHIAAPAFFAAIAWICTRGMSGSERKSRWLAFGVSSILAVLAFFKFPGVLVRGVNAILSAAGVSTLRIPSGIELPIGISICSFAAIAFLVDMRQGRIKTAPLSQIGAFLTFWPTIMAGPILRYREISSQLGSQQQFQWQTFLRGVDRIVWGLVQKNLIANSLSPGINEGFLPRAAQLNSTIDNWFLAAAFGLHIYFDFAGYSNIAIGAANLLGISIPENFRFPYHAPTPSEFWSRWHMTLSRWIRDYVFFPLSARFRGSSLLFYLSLIGAMAFVGLWHGASWGFILWGIMHGFYLVVHRIYQNIYPPVSGGERRVPGGLEVLAWRAFTLFAVVAAWVPFRAESLGQSANMLQSMLFDFSLRVSYPVNFYLLTVLVAGFCALEPLLCSALLRMEKWALADRRLLVPNLTLVRPFLYACGLFLFMIFDDRETSFIYFQF
jgi:alginate O-acetyltransferase complex protein AlgI